MTTDPRTELIGFLTTQMQAAGITVADLRAGNGAPPAATLPTVREAVANIRAKANYSAKTFKTYDTGWKLLDEAHGDQRLDELTFEDLEQVARTAQRNAAERWARRNEVRRQAGRRTYDHDGRGAFENCLRAVRALYVREYKKGRLPLEQSPAAQVDLPGRRPTARRPLGRRELKLVFEVASSGGDDPVLDTLIVRTGYETGARQEGLINLRLKDLNAKRQTVMLDEKFGKQREQPVSVELLAALERFARERGAVQPDDSVFRLKPRGGSSVGRPITSRRFDTLVQRVRDGDPDLEELHFVYHLLRHTVGRRVERAAGKAVARRFLGHAPVGGDVTDGYTKALDGETAAAWSVVMGEAHPLAEGYDPTW
jgi:integrase